MANTVAGLSPPIIVNRKPISFYKPHLLSYKQIPSSALQHRSQSLTLSFHLSRKSPKDAYFRCFSRSRTVRVIEEGARKQRNRLFSVFGSLTDDSELNPEEESKESSEGKVASIDIKLPRRSLLVEFSCNSCGERTKRLINRLAYERGLVFVQCGGCLKHHKLVDNLGLIVEYDFRQETSRDSSTEQL